jgi:hypothetical protein
MNQDRNNYNGRVRGSGRGEVAAVEAAMAVTTPPILHGRLLLHGRHTGVDIGVHHGLAPLDPVSLAPAHRRLLTPISCSSHPPCLLLFKRHHGTHLVSFKHSRRLRCSNPLIKPTGTWILGHPHT